MTEIVIGEEVHSEIESKQVKCFLCNKFIDSNKEEVLLLFEKRIDENGIENSPLSDILSSIVARNIDKNNSHSKFICQPCTQILQEFELIEQHYIELKCKIIRNFNKVAKEINIPEIELSNIVIEEDDSERIIEFHTSTTFLESQTSESEDEQHKNHYHDNDDIEKDSFVVEEIETKNISKTNLDINPDDDFKEIVTVPVMSKEDYDSQNEDQSEQIFVHDEDHIIEVMPHEEISDVHYEHIIEQNSDTNDIISNETDCSNLENTSDANDEKDSNLIKVENIDLINKTSTSPQFNDNKRHRTNKLEKILPFSQPVYVMNGEKVVCLICNPNYCQDNCVNNIITSESDEQKTIIEFDFRTISIHLKSIHNIRVYICDICGKEFHKRNEMNDHVDKEHGGTKDGKYSCEICNRIFTNLRLFRVHKRLHYNLIKQYSCTQCDKKYISKNLLEEHMNIHTGERPYKCSYCSKDFASKYTLTAHLKIHQDRPRPYVCLICSKAFFNAQNLQQHEKTHSGIKEFICEICQKAFGTQHNLDVHKIVHTGYKPYICRICGKAFARRTEIKDHERTHTGEKPFSCNICNMSFAQRSNLTTHKRATHLNDKRFKCDQCDRSFKRRRLLDYHIRAAHTGERPYKCDVCGASFVYPEHFKKHQRIHSGEKPYACEVCGKKFNSRDNRNAHRFVHSDKKPYECLSCGQGFMRKPLLYSHMQQAGHINDTIVVNQPRLSKDGELIKIDEDDLMIDQENQETIGEHFIINTDDVQGVITSENEDVIPTQILAAEHSNVTEVITPDQVLIDDCDSDNQMIKSENCLMHIVQVLPE